ncbi:hypothetical protein Tco_0232973 [Tanacetum coccineum]
MLEHRISWEWQSKLWYCDYCNREEGDMLLTARGKASVLQVAVPKNQEEAMILSTFKKRVLHGAKEKGRYLDAKRSILANVECTAPYDQPLAMATTNIFEVNHEDAYDSDVDEGPNAAAAFMANLYPPMGNNHLRDEDALRRNNPDSNVESELDDTYDSVSICLNLKADATLFLFQMISSRIAFMGKDDTIRNLQTRKHYENVECRTKPAMDLATMYKAATIGNHRILPSKSVNARRAADHNRKLNVVDHNQFVIRSLKSVNTKTPQAKHSMNHTKKVWKATRNHNVNTTKTAWRPTGKRTASIRKSDTSVLEDLKALSWKTCQEGSLLNLSDHRLVPSCFVIFDLEPLSLSFDFVFTSEIFKSLSFSLDRLCHLAILCLDQHAHTSHLFESLLTISLDRLDILKEDLVYQSLRKSLSLILELS